MKLVAVRSGVGVRVGRRVFVAVGVVVGVRAALADVRGLGCQGRLVQARVFGLAVGVGPGVLLRST